MPWCLVVLVSGCLLLMLAGGCQSGLHDWAVVAGDPAPPASIPETGGTGFQPADRAGTAFAPAPARTAPVFRAPLPARIDMHLHVLHVQAPRAARPQVTPLWDGLREDALPSEVTWRLRRNGVRVGVGRTDRWDEVKAVLDRVTDRRVHELPPLRTLPGVPVALELDRRPTDQTIFYVGSDEILSGHTWPSSQKVLRLTYTLDARQIERVHLSVVPEIRQAVPAGLWYDKETGWSAGPQRRGQAFAAGGFVIRLEPGEFVLLAPGTKADLAGMLGGAFLTEERAGRRYDSYVFVQVEVRHVRQ